MNKVYLNRDLYVRLCHLKPGTKGILYGLPADEHSQVTVKGFYICENFNEMVQILAQIWNEKEYLVLGWFQSIAEPLLPNDVASSAFKIFQVAYFNAKFKLFSIQQSFHFDDSRVQQQFRDSLIAEYLMGFSKYIGLIILKGQTILESDAQIMKVCVVGYCYSPTRETDRRIRSSVKATVDVNELIENLVDVTNEYLRREGALSPLFDSLNKTNVQRNRSNIANTTAKNSTNSNVNQTESENSDQNSIMLSDALQQSAGCSTNNTTTVTNIVSSNNNNTSENFKSTALFSSVTSTSKIFQKPETDDTPMKTSECIFVSELASQSSQNKSQATLGKQEQGMNPLRNQNAASNSNDSRNDNKSSEKNNDIKIDDVPIRSELTTVNMNSDANDNFSLRLSGDSQPQDISHYQSQSIQNLNTQKDDGTEKTGDSSNETKHIEIEKQYNFKFSKAVEKLDNSTQNCSYSEEKREFFERLLAPVELGKLQLLRVSVFKSQGSGFFLAVKERESNVLSKDEETVVHDALESQLSPLANQSISAKQQLLEEQIKKTFDLAMCYNQEAQEWLFYQYCDLLLDKEISALSKLQAESQPQFQSQSSSHLP
jgi:hypothetical protein